MSAGPQAMFVVEYPCDRFCRIEVDLGGERDQLTLRQMWDKAEQAHQQIHEPQHHEAQHHETQHHEPAAEPEASGRPAATVFLSAPGRGGERRR